jgi:SAM-dependent methyltransferase
MKYTGERPDLTHDFVASRIRYKSILPFCFDKNVLDFGCGIGHGSYLLSHFSKKVVGYDKDDACIAEAGKLFSKDNLEFTSKLDVDPETEVFASVECIEHLEKDELVEVLSKYSKTVPSFISTTPNGNMFHYRPKTLDERRGFHTWHYTYKELVELFSQFYQFVDVSGIVFDDSLVKTYSRGGWTKGEYTSYRVFASNAFSNWSGKWLEPSPLKK